MRTKPKGNEVGKGIPMRYRRTKGEESQVPKAKGTGEEASIGLSLWKTLHDDKQRRERTGGARKYLYRGGQISLHYYIRFRSSPTREQGGFSRYDEYNDTDSESERSPCQYFPTELYHPGKGSDDPGAVIGQKELAKKVSRAK